VLGTSLSRKSVVVMDVHPGCVAHSTKVGVALWQLQLLPPLAAPPALLTQGAELIYGDAAAVPTRNVGMTPGLSVCHKGGAAAMGAAGCV
jgi:hypothetical protein